MLRAIQSEFMYDFSISNDDSDLPKYLNIKLDF
jgi:hypothetical protein